jgi:hypothetical protein
MGSSLTSGVGGVGAFIPSGSGNDAPYLGSIVVLSPTLRTRSVGPVNVVFTRSAFFFVASSRLRRYSRSRRFHT